MICDKATASVRRGQFSSHQHEFVFPFVSTKFETSVPRDKTRRALCVAHALLQGQADEVFFVFLLIDHALVVGFLQNHSLIPDGYLYDVGATLDCF